MLALCVHHGWDTTNYLPLEHPVQQLILSTIVEMTGVEKEHIHAAVDGCGVPVFYVPLKNLALAYARLAEPFLLEESRLNGTQQAIKKLMSAACTHPEWLPAMSGYARTSCGWRVKASLPKPGQKAGMP